MSVAKDTCFAVRLALVLCALHICTYVYLLYKQMYASTSRMTCFVGLNSILRCLKQPADVHLAEERNAYVLEMVLATSVVRVIENVKWASTLTSIFWPCAAQQQKMHCMRHML